MTSKYENIGVFASPKQEDDREYGRFSNHHPSVGSSARADGGAYSERDTQLFENLTHFPGSVAASGTDVMLLAPVTMAGPMTDESQKSAFNYDDDDTLKFENLMDQLSDYRDTACPGKPFTGDYTDKDDRLFEELMSTACFPSNVPVSCDVETSETEEKVFQYTKQDNAEFHKILPLSSEPENEPLYGGGLVKSQTDRDVGPIRIVDSDKERLRASKAHVRGGENIKIRFFD